MASGPGQLQCLACSASSPTAPPALHARPPPPARPPARHSTPVAPSQPPKADDVSRFHSAPGCCTPGTSPAAAMAPGQPAHTSMHAREVCRPRAPPRAAAPRHDISPFYRVQSPRKMHCGGGQGRRGGVDGAGRGRRRGRRVRTSAARGPAEPQPIPSYPYPPIISPHST